VGGTFGLRRSRWRLGLLTGLALAITAAFPTPARAEEETIEGTWVVRESDDASTVGTTVVIRRVDGQYVIDERHSGPIVQIAAPTPGRRIEATSRQLTADYLATFEELVAEFSDVPHAVLRQAAGVARVRIRFDLSEQGDRLYRAQDGITLHWDTDDLTLTGIEPVPEHVRSVLVRSAGMFSDDPRAALRRRPQEAAPQGVYALEHEMAFNVLDAAYLDAGRGTVTLAGHWDARAGCGRICWLQHLAELLERPRPRFSLEWTAESEARVDRFLEAPVSAEEQQRWAQAWGDLFDAQGGVSAAGRLMFPGMGVTPTKNGAAPGRMGLALADRGDHVEVTAIEPGSPAATAGIPVGARLERVDGQDPIDPAHFDHVVRTLGAGASCPVGVRRADGQIVPYRVVLTAVGGDPWQGLDRNEVVACVFRAAGMTDAAEVTYWFGAQMRRKDGTHEEAAFQGFLGALGLTEKWDRYDREIARGKRDKNAAIREFMRDIAIRCDAAYRLGDRPATAALDASFARSGEPSAALEAAYGALETARVRALGGALTALWAKPGGIQVHPTLVAQAIGVTPTVRPQYLELDGTSQLARVLFDADYLGKRLLHTPGLAARVPGYQTAFEFESRRGGGVGASTREFRMWISVAAPGTRQSPDGSGLEFRGTRMQFNVRERDASGREHAPAAGGYEQLLTSLYDGLAREFPVLHELRECAKVAAVAQWIRAAHPGFALPREGRVAWNGPATLPGAVHMYLHPPRGAGRFDTAIFATGGVSLAFSQPFPADAGVVDLRGSALTSTPAPFENEALAKVLGRKIEVPKWRPEGWVARATKGEQTTSAVTVALDAAKGDPASSVALEAKLENARRIAERLAQVEKALNVLTQENPNRQAEWRDLVESLRKSEEEFVSNASLIVTSGLVDLKVMTGHPDLLALSAEAGEAVAAIDGLDSAVSKARLAWSVATADDIASRQAATKALTETLSSMVQGADGTALKPLGGVLVPAKRALGWATVVEPWYRVGRSLGTLGEVSVRVKALDFRVDAEGKALREHLLPMRQRLSESLDSVLADPDVRRALNRN
jgi:hypothetical protein